MVIILYTRTIEDMNMIIFLSNEKCKVTIDIIPIFFRAHLEITRHRHEVIRLQQIHSMLRDIQHQIQSLRMSVDQIVDDLGEPPAEMNNSTSHRFVYIVTDIYSSKQEFCVGLRISDIGKLWKKCRLWFSSLCTRVTCCADEKKMMQFLFISPFHKC